MQNDVNGLNWLHKFGWLRPTELGRLLWPSSNTSKHQADRLVRSWRRRCLVLERSLPEHAGRALVLATRGVRFLDEHGVHASTGKDIGHIHGAVWTPPTTWRHDLLSAGVLADLYVRGYEVFPEVHIKRHGGSLAKVPDGIAARDSQVIWLETESARKTGRSMSLLAEALCAVGEGAAATVMGLRPTQAMVAFSSNQRDERCHALNHRQRVRTAVAAATQKAVPLVWAECCMSGAGLESVHYVSELIEADRATAVLRRLDASGWKPETGVVMSTYGSRRAQVWEDEEAGCWAWQVDDLPGGRVDNISRAKRCCAEQIALLSAR